MNLINFNEWPPGGWSFRQPEINWVVPDPMQSLQTCAEQLSVARYQNPASGLDPSVESCIQAIGEFTCKRGEGKDWFSKFCTSDTAVAQAAIAARSPSCGGCGK